MKQLTLFLTFLLLTTTLNAKNRDFSIVIDKPFHAKLNSVVEDYDGDISAVGFVEKHHIQKKHQTSYTDAFEYLASVGDNNGIQMQLIKLSAQTGDTIFERSVNLPHLSEAISLKKTATNGYYVGGHTLDGQLIILKLDSQGNRVFQKIFGTKNNDRLNSIITLRDGGVLAIATSTTSRFNNDPLFESGLGLNDIYLTRFSKNGKKLWSKKYGTSYDDRGIDAAEAYDGSIVVVGLTKFDANNSITLMRLGENGNKIWLKELQGTKNITPKKLLKLRDNNFLLSLAQEDEMRKEQVRLIKFDLHKNILIDKVIHTRYNSVLNDIKEYADGNIVGAGYVRDTYNTDGLVMMFDAKLNQLYQEHFGEDSYDTFESVSILKNSQAVCGGFFTHNNSQRSNMWIAKINRDASLAQLSAKAPHLYEMLQEIYTKEIANNQIKISQDLSIEFTDARLHFGVGAFELTKTQKIFLKKFAQKLLPLLHKYQDQIKTLEVNGHTSSEWGKSGFTQSYLKNEELSMKRAFSTLSYIFNTQDTKTQKWLTKVLKGSGLSYAKKITFQNVENKAKSRRISLKIIL